MLRLALAAGLLATISVVQDEAGPPAEPVAAEPPALEAVDSQRLAHVRRWNSRVLTGGRPYGPDAFEELAELGVRTAISVDGAAPDVASARAAGIRYVHLPLGYGATPRERVVALAKAVRDLPAPLYIHCHHGKHRAPVAAAIGCVGAGLMDASNVDAHLQAAGTNRGYEELCRSAVLALPLPSAVIDAYREPFPETAEVQPLAAAMAEMDVYHSRLTEADKAGWPEASLKSSASDALLLKELAAELLRNPPEEQPEGYSELLRQVEREADRIRSRLVLGDSAEAALARVSGACLDCHERYRDADY